MEEEKQPYGDASPFQARFRERSTAGRMLFWNGRFVAVENEGELVRLSAYLLKLFGVLLADAMRLVC
jgi:hypothetical protein